MTEQNSKYNARDEASNSLLRKYFCVNLHYRQVIDNNSREFQASNCAKECRLNWAEPREVKHNSQNFLKPTVKGQSKATWIEKLLVKLKEKIK